MKHMEKGFTLIEMLVVIAIIGILAGMLSGPLMKARRQAQLISCTNNLKQMGTAMMQYQMNFDNSAPLCGDATNAKTAASLDSCTKELASANLLRLYVAGLCDNLQLFICPLATEALPDTSDTNKNTTEKVLASNDGTTMTHYNLTAGYASSDPANKIIVADAPYKDSATNTTWSIHDEETKMVDGPGCLYADGHVKTEKSLNPQGCSLYELDTTTASGTIYKKSTKTTAKQKITYIQYTGKASSGS